MSWKKLNIGDVIKSTGFRFVEEINIQNIFTDFGANHRRLRVFNAYGLKCSNSACRNIGTRLIKAQDAGGGYHWDVYTDSLILMNVDHIVAKNNGGNDYIKNLQPMCKLCNCLKGSLQVTNEELAVLYKQRLIDIKERKQELKDGSDLLTEI